MDEMKDTKSFFALMDEYGNYLPEGRHSTTSIEYPFLEGWPPRLYLTAAAAKCALIWWRKGVAYVERSGGRANSFSYYGYDDYDENLIITPIPSRKEAKVRVVKITLCVAEIK